MDSAQIAKPWEALKPLSGPTPTKPAKDATFTTPYKRAGRRFSDHTIDVPGVEFVRNDYSRRQPYNCDNTFVLLYSDGGHWHLFDAKTAAHVRQLTGPAGDCDIQWDKTQPHVLYYTDNNGGTVIHKLDVTTNITSVQYDFTTAIHALFPTAARCLTKAEGSPDKTGAFWGLMVMTNSFGMLGYVVLNIFKKGIVWHKADTVAPDHCSMSPSGKWFVRSGDDSAGTRAYNIKDGSTRQLHHKSEHSDLFVCANGHDGYFSIDYQTNAGDIFWIDLEDSSVTRHVVAHAYGDTNFGTDYSFHISGKAFNKPGWICISQYGRPYCQLFLVNTANGKMHGLGEGYAVDADYWDEAQGCPNADLTKYMYNDNYGISDNVDAYELDVPALPRT